MRSNRRGGLECVATSGLESEMAGGLASAAGRLECVVGGRGCEATSELECVAAGGGFGIPAAELA